MSPTPGTAAHVRVSIVGSGRLAGSLATALAATAGPGGHDVLGLAGRDRDRTAACARRSGVPMLQEVDAVTRADLVVLAVSDDALTEVTGRLAAAAQRRPRSTPTGVVGALVHCSGARGIEDLEPAARLGWSVGAWHPMQAFPTPATPPAPGATWTITTADPALGDMLGRLTHALGGTPKPLAAKGRAAYHAAAVMASNHAAALVAQAAELLTDHGFSREEALTSLLPLARSALDALASQGVPGGLTGPMVRGDLSTIEAHVDALGTRPALRDLYCATGRGLAPFSLARGIGPDLLRRLDAALAPLDAARPKAPDCDADAHRNVP